ncbi:MAG: hypothetical protein V1841_01635 [Patescibacteria group bacterium]
MTIDDFFLFFLSPTWQNIIAILKPLGLLAIFIFLLAIIWALTKSKWLYWYVIWDSEDFWKGAPVPFQKKARETWQQIKKQLLSKKESDWKKAIIDGERIVQDVLLKMGYKGMNIKEKLETATKVQIPNIEELSTASEIYENIISNPDYRITRDRAASVVKAFEDFLEYFEYLS